MEQVLSFQPDQSWTLFLDRDGVINKLLQGTYVTNWDEFEILEGVLEAIPIFRKYFGHIVVVTNQQGIGKKIMMTEDLELIFEKLQAELIKNGTSIDYFYYCPHLQVKACHCRKPKTGMGLQAKKDFPEIDFKKSVIVGDSMSDMEFGRNLGMKTVWIDHQTFTPKRKGLFDLKYASLIEFAQELNN